MKIYNLLYLVTFGLYVSAWMFYGGLMMSPLAGREWSGERLVTLSNGTLDVTPLKVIKEVHLGFQVVAYIQDLPYPEGSGMEAHMLGWSEGCKMDDMKDLEECTRYKPLMLSYYIGLAFATVATLMLLLKFTVCCHRLKRIVFGISALVSGAVGWILMLICIILISGWIGIMDLSRFTFHADVIGSHELLKQYGFHVGVAAVALHSLGVVANAVAVYLDFKEPRQCRSTETAIEML